MSEQLGHQPQELIQTVHDTSMDRLRRRGVVIENPKALDLFKNNGFKVSGKSVFPTETQILATIAKVPSTFTLGAGNPVQDIIIGEEHFSFLPGHGASAIVTSNGIRRKATMEDYDTFCKLVHTSKHLKMNGWKIVEPTDMSEETVHLDMILSNMLLCDKPLIGYPSSTGEVRDSIEMAGIFWGGKDEIKEKPVMVSCLYAEKKMTFSSQMLDSLIYLTSYGQPCVIGYHTIETSSWPYSVEDLLAQQNAEILTGIVLTQLVRSSAPALYGAVLMPENLQESNHSSGISEISRSTEITAQLAGFYNLPSVSAGGNTYSHFPDAQAGAESALTLYLTVRNGINFVLQACGVLDSCRAMSFEKFLIDEEICGVISQILHPGLIDQHQTNSQEASMLAKTVYENWEKSGKKRIDEVADDQLTRRLAKYEKPDIDPAIEQELTEYVNRRKIAIAEKL